MRQPPRPDQVGILSGSKSSRRTFLDRIRTFASQISGDPSLALDRAMATSDSAGCGYRRSSWSPAKSLARLASLLARYIRDFMGAPKPACIHLETLLRQLVIGAKSVDRECPFIQQRREPREPRYIGQHEPCPRRAGGSLAGPRRPTRPVSAPGSQLVSPRLMRRGASALA